MKAASDNENAATVTPITRARDGGVNKPTAQDLIDQVAVEMEAIARELGERQFMEAPRDSWAWYVSARKVIRVWRQRQQGSAGSSRKGAAASRRR